MKCKLANICDFAKQKIDVASLDISNYISTENMMPNKEGIADAATLPNVVQTQSFEKGDTLVSNIRPYFKKIWYASFEGGCSNDVLVFRAKTNVNPRFLYYVLADDTFFEYATSTAKGTKMPRGDKKAILEYEVPDISYKEQEKIANVLSALDDKIALNQQINKNLEEQAQAIYKERFFSATENVLSDICSYSRERVSVETLSFDNYFSTENMLTNKAGWTIAANLPTTSHVIKCHIGDVLVSNIRPYFKKILYCHHDCGCSNDVLCFTPKSQKLSAFLYGTLYADRFFDFMVAGAKGTKMPRGDKQQIMTYPIKMPSTEELEAYNSLAVPMLQIIYNNTSENIRLAAIRDALLPRLMSGEIDVSGIEI